MYFYIIINMSIDLILVIYTSYMDIDEFLENHEYYGVIENVKNIVKRL